MKPQYVCIITTNGVGGIWSVVKESLPLLLHYYEVSVVIYSVTGKLESAVVTFLENLDIRYIVINIKYSNGWVFEFCKLMKLAVVKRFLPNTQAIIHSHDSYLSGILLFLLRSKNYSLFCTFHGAMIKGTNLKSKIQFILNKHIRLNLLYYSKAHLISCDPYSISIIKSYFPFNVHIDLAVNGVKSTLYPKNNTSSVFTIGYVSRFHPLKGWDVLAKACEIVKEKGFDIRLIFAGTGECEGAAKEWCRVHNDYCLFMGQVDDIHKNILPLIDIHVLPTIYPEGLPMVLLETMAAGIPSITTSVGSCSYAVKNGVNGIVINPNVEELVSSIILLLSNPNLRKKMAMQCLQIWQNEFSSESMVQNYHKIFEKYV